MPEGDYGDCSKAAYKMANAKLRSVKEIPEIDGLTADQSATANEEHTPSLNDRYRGETINRG